MTYTPRYLWTFHNELNELVEIFFDAKGGFGTTYSGNAVIVVLTPNGFNLVAGMEIDAIQIGQQITFDGQTGTIASFSPDLDFTYTITVLESVFTPGPPSARDFTIGPPDTDPGLQTFENIVDCKLNKSSDSSLITDPIVWSELNFSINLPVGSSIEFETFLFSDHDAWKVRMEVDGQPVFHGFLVPDEGSIVLQDKPYDINFKAVDGLKLLSNTSLVSYDGSEFKSYHTFVELIAACLQQTGLELNFRVYCNIYYNPMVTRAANIQYDAFQQMYLDYRTFMTSPTQFVNCYDALVIMLKDHFQLRYDKGMWVIYRVTEAQYLPEGNRYYTDYQWTGSIIGGAIDGDDFGLVGQNQITRAIEETQQISARFAYKTVRHTFNYNIWAELPRNNKFERGILVGPPPGDSTHKYYTIESWTVGRPVFGTYPIRPDLTTTTGTFYRVSTLNSYGVEIDRYIEHQHTGATESSRSVLVSPGIPVNQDDIIDLSLDFKIETNSTPNPNPILGMAIYLVPDDATPIQQLNNNGGALTDKFVWASSLNGMFFNNDSGDLSAEYTSLNGSSKPVPKNGKLYIVFYGWVDNHYGKMYYKNFSITLHPYIAGGYIPVTGDYWTRTQNKSLPDTYEAEVSVSDSPIGAGKGTLLFFGGIKTVTDWWRYGLGGSEIRHYKELVNLGIYNLTYRRFKKIEGDWDGTKYTNHVDLMQYPLSFTPRYKFEDLGDQLYLLCCPVTIDYAKGRFTGTFQEVYASVADGTQEGDSSQFNYLFE